MKSCVSICMVLLCLMPSISAGEKYAVIVSAKSGEQQYFDINRKCCQDTKALFVKAGFSVSNILTFIEGGDRELPGSQDVDGDAVLKALKSIAGKSRADDELWLFLYGHANLTQRGLSFATKGKRIKGEDLALILDDIRARQHVFCMNTQSAPLMKLLSSSSNRVVVTATSSEGQLNPPRFPEYLLAAWSEDAARPLKDVLFEAGELTEKYYSESSTAVSELSQVFDGREICAFPFDKFTGTNLSMIRLTGYIAPEIAVTGTPALPVNQAAVAGEKPRGTPLDFSEFDKDTNAAGAEASGEIELMPELMPATDETRRIIDSAAEAAAQYKWFSAFYPHHEEEYTVNADQSSDLIQDQQLYLLQDIAADQYGRMVLDDSPPDYELKIKQARIIYSDGTYRDVKPQRTYNNSSRQRYSYLKFPQPKAGCLIMVSLNYHEQSDISLPIYQKDFLLQRPVPTASAKLKLRVPRKQFFNYKLYRVAATPKETESEYSRLLDFDFGSIPALEPLPNDPPFMDCSIRLQISSLKSWNDFAGWAHRIMDKADAIDDETIAFTRELTKNARTQTEKVKAIYEFLNELRYETMPMGARGFRPRVPAKVCKEKYGDCKDKANALVAMAGSLGITGYMALANRFSMTDTNLPAWQFNHAVAFFPKLEEYPDGLWCDATDGSSPFGSLPPGDIGRSGFLLIKPSGRFETIQLPGGYVNTMSVRVDLSVDKTNAVAGLLRYEATGLSEYFLRHQFKWLSPLQQKHSFQSLANESFLGLTVEQPEMTPLQDMTRSFFIEAKCSGTGWPYIKGRLLPPLDLWKFVAVAERNRPLQLNDGQPLVLRQTINISGSSSKITPSVWEKKTSWLEAKVEYTTQRKSWSRVCELNLLKPVISADDYKTFRAQVIELYEALNLYLEQP